MSNRKSKRIVEEFPGQLPSCAPKKAYVQCSQALLAIKDGREFLPRKRLRGGAVGITLVKIQHKVIVSVVLNMFRLDVPVEKGPKRVALQQAIEESAYLPRIPNEFPLNCRQHQVFTLNGVQGLLDGAACLVRHGVTPWWSLPLAVPLRPVGSNRHGSRNRTST